MRDAVPRLSRSLIGDVTIDMLPGPGPALSRPEPSPGSAPCSSRARSRLIHPRRSKPRPRPSTVPATPSNRSTRRPPESPRYPTVLENLDSFLTSVTDAGKNVSKAAKSIDDLVKANEANFRPAIADLREVAAKLNKTFDPDTQAALKAGLDRFSSAAARLDSGLAQLDPVLKDLGAPVNHTPSTDIGQAVRRINVLAADLELLTSKLRDGRGGLNTDGTIQKLLTQAELHDNFNSVALSINRLWPSFEPYWPT